jgi:NitT/TauT family transport system substrate-binding protein
MKYVQMNHIATNRILQQLMLDEVLKLLVDRENKRRIYTLRPDMVEQASNLMFENGMLSRPITYEELIAE